jgi:Lon protease-like protein
LSGRDLPRIIPIFPLSGALLLPRGRLPLNIFEPRYLAMVRAALAAERIIGMIQPTDPDSPSQAPEIYRTGCAGRITAFSETDDGRFLITLTGVARFRVEEELTCVTPYRQVAADYTPFSGDLDAPDDAAAAKVDRERLLPALRAYLELNGMAADWQAIAQAPSETLINALAMICPFASSEKQALLEAPTLVDRAGVMTALIEMAVAQSTSGGDAPVQ